MTPRVTFCPEKEKNDSSTASEKLGLCHKLVKSYSWQRRRNRSVVGGWREKGNGFCQRGINDNDISFSLKFSSAPHFTFSSCFTLPKWSSTERMFSPPGALQQVFQGIPSMLYANKFKNRDHVVVYYKVMSQQVVIFYKVISAWVCNLKDQKRTVPGKSVSAWIAYFFRVSQHKNVIYTEK